MPEPTDGKTYQVEYFNLDAILSVGYRVNSQRGTQFRIWATGVLRDHLIRGYLVNERRLTEEWIEIFPDLTLDECLAAVRDDPWFQP